MLICLVLNADLTWKNGEDKLWRLLLWPDLLFQRRRAMDPHRPFVTGTASHDLTMLSNGWVFQADIFSTYSNHNIFEMTASSSCLRTRGTTCMEFENGVDPAGFVKELHSMSFVDGFWSTVYFFPKSPRLSYIENRTASTSGTVLLLSHWATQWHQEHPERQ